MMFRDTEQFDLDNKEKLQGMWFLGDVHANFSYLHKALKQAEKIPNWLIFLGDLDLEHSTFKACLEPIQQEFPSVKVAFIPGNHDGDTYLHNSNLMACGDAAVCLEGKVVDLDGIKVAGLGGNFLGRVWAPPAEPLFRNKEKAMNRGAYQFRSGQLPSPSFLTAIYPDVFDRLSRQKADILVTHEAPDCHRNGWVALSDLARSMRVVRSFHGHQHDDESEEYKKELFHLKYDARAVAYCSIKNGLGEVIFDGPSGW